MQCIKNEKMFPISPKITCRTCLTEDMEASFNFYSISRLGQVCGRETTLTEMLNMCTPLQVAADDGLSQLMCYKCVLQISRAFVFASTCIESDEVLRKPDLLSNPSPNNMQDQALESEQLDTTVYLYEDEEIEEAEEITDSTVLMTEQLQENYHQSRNQPASNLLLPIENSDTLNNENPIEYFLSDNITHVKQERHTSQSDDGMELSEDDESDYENLERENVHILVEIQQTDEIQQDQYDFRQKLELDQPQQQLDEEETILVESSNEEGESEQFKDSPPFDITNCSICSENENTCMPPKPENVSPIIKTETKSHKPSTQRVLGSKKKSGPKKKSIPMLYQCHDCEKILRNINSYKYHMQLHSNDTPFLCNVCGMGFKTKNSYDGHMTTHNANNPNKCGICGKTYRQASSLRSHMISHTGEKPYPCEICGKSMTQKSGYKKHMLTHTGAKPYKCDLCDSTFRYSSNLYAHKRCHTGERPHVCTFCDKAFTGSVVLKQHMLIHTGEKPFECEFCHRRFNRKSILVKHRHLHRVKTFLCPVCDINFTILEALQKHMARLHPEYEQNQTEAEQDTEDEENLAQ